LSQEWKDKYILAWIPIAPAYGGSVKELKVLTTGINDGVYWI